MHAFELGSVHYDNYVVNIRLPYGKGYNTDFGQLKSLNIAVSTTHLLITCLLLIN
jgi:hypothetical protein